MIRDPDARGRAPGGRRFAPCRAVDSAPKEPALSPKIEEDPLEAYLQRLPDGAASYPEYRAKGSLLRALTHGHNIDTISQRLPATVRSMFDSRPTVTSWLPEVHLNLALLATRELFFESDDDFLADAYRRNRVLLEGPLYQVLTKFFSPERVGAMGRTVFNKLHQGIELQVVAGDTYRWSLHYAPNLVPGLVARCYATAATAALELGGARVSTEVVKHDAQQFEIAIHRLD